METPALLNELNNSYGLDLPQTATIEALEAILAKKIDAMIIDDFNRLISLLYRIDVNESKLKQLLKENPGTNAGLLIARLILERQWQKIETRRKYRS
ncbi:MAG TPA: hypothetical protein VFE32_07245 [Puia sp.]|jgi:hypothetical protein|nr:hypothetical protein [Puia sp.]